MNDNTDICHPL